MIIATLILSGISNLIVSSLTHAFISHQQAIKNYQTSWQIIRLMEQDAEHILKSEAPEYCIDKLLQQEVNELIEDEAYITLSIEKHLLSYKRNTNYALFIQIQRKLKHETEELSAKITAWHFGA